MATKIDGKTPMQPTRLTSAMMSGLPKRTAQSMTVKPTSMVKVK